MSDGIMVYKKLEELEEKIDNILDLLEEREIDVDSEEVEDSGEDSLPPDQKEEEQEKEPEEVEAPEVVESGQQVSKGQMKALNKTTPKLVPQSKQEEEKWENDFRE